MTATTNLYTYRITWSEEDQEFIGLCAEFSSLSWLDTTPEKALQGIRELITDIVEDMRNNGESIPEPLTNRQYSGKFMVRVPPELHRQLSLQAAESGISLNRLASNKLAS